MKLVAQEIIELRTMTGFMTITTGSAGFFEPGTTTILAELGDLISKWIGGGNRSS